MRINKDRAICSTLLFLMVVYYAQDAFGIPGMGIIILPLAFTLSIPYVIKLFGDNSCDNVILFIILLFIAHNFFYFSISSNPADEINILRQVLINFFLFFPFYYFSKNEILDRRAVLLVFYFLLLFSILSFLKSNEILREQKRIAVDNKSYLIMGLLPFLFLIKIMVVFSLAFVVILFYLIFINYI